jgi:hypothetical protein
VQLRCPCCGAKVEVQVDLRPGKDATRGAVNRRDAWAELEDAALRKEVERGE